MGYSNDGHLAYGCPVVVEQVEEDEGNFSYEYDDEIVEAMLTTFFDDDESTYGFFIRESHTVSWGAEPVKVKFPIETFPARQAEWDAALTKALEASGAEQDGEFGWYVFSHRM